MKIPKEWGQAPYDMWLNPGTAFSDGATGVYGEGWGSAPAELFQGDYITLYFMGMGIALEYYH